MTALLVVAGSIAVGVVALAVVVAAVDRFMRPRDSVDEEATKRYGFGGTFRGGGSVGG